MKLRRRTILGLLIITASLGVVTAGYLWVMWPRWSVSSFVQRMRDGDETAIALFDYSPGLIDFRQPDVIMRTYSARSDGGGIRCGFLRAENLWRLFQVADVEYKQRTFSEYATGKIRFALKGKEDGPTFHW